MEIYKSYVDEDLKEWTKIIIRKMKLRIEDEAINYNNNGCDLSRVGKYEEALAEHNKAIILDPCNVYFLKEKIGVLLKLGIGDEAIEMFDEVIAIEPDNDKSYNSKGYILAKLGRYEESIVEYEKAIELQPNYAALYKNKGVSINKIARHLTRSKSTISMELKRNKVKGKYMPCVAQEKYKKRMCQQELLKIEKTPMLLNYM